MGIKEWIASLSHKMRQGKEKYDDMEEDYTLHKKLEGRQKSANERELEGYMERDRQERIKRMLDQYRKRQTREWWNGNNLLKQKNLFKNNKNIFKGKGVILRNG